MKKVFTLKKLAISRISTGLFCLMFLSFMGLSSTQAQVIFTEGFEWTAGTSPTPPSITLPLGWTQGKDGAGSDPDNYWDRVTVATGGFNVPTTAHGGNVFMRFRAGAVNSGEGSMLVSRPYDFSNSAVAGVASLWMWRDDTYVTHVDSMRVFANTSPNLTGATLLTTTVGAYTSIRRHRTLAPVASPNTWNQYSYNIPAAFYGPAPVYIIVVATSRNLSPSSVANRPNIFIDDFSIFWTCN